MHFEGLLPAEVQGDRELPEQGGEEGPWQNSVLHPAQEAEV